MTNPLQGSDEETQERITNLRRWLADGYGYIGRDDVLALLSDRDSLESALREAQKDRDAVIRECANVADAELRALYAEYRDTHRDEQECAQAIRNNILAKLSEFSRADTGEST